MKHLLHALLILLTATTVRAATVEVDLSPVAGRNLQNLYGDYLGIYGKPPAKAQIDFEANLADLWERKSNHRKLTDSARAYTAQALVRYQQSKTRMTVQQYVARAELEIDRVRKHIDWHGLCEQQRLNARRCEVLKAIATRISGKDLVAYGLTELMPSADGRFNVHYLDLLLKNAGVEFIESVPAISDGMLSLGFYQFTSHAVRHDETTIAGASLINQHIAKPAKIPGSVAHLRGNDHHRAAFCFALYNLSGLLKKVSDTELKVLDAKRGEYHSQIVQYIAASHYLPKPAQRGMRYWLENGMRGDLRNSLRARVRMYAFKTDANLRALQEIVR